MNRQEHLLTILIEECAEVQKAATKALRFGLRDIKPDGNETNEDDISRELNDVYAMVEMLNYDGLQLHPDVGLRAEKKNRVEKYLLYSEKRGTLDDFDYETDADIGN